MDNLTQEVQVRIGLSNSTNHLRIARLSSIRAALAKEAGDQSLFTEQIAVAHKRLTAAQKALSDYLGRPVKSAEDAALDAPLQERFGTYFSSVERGVALAQNGTTQQVIEHEYKSNAPQDDNYNQILLKNAALSTVRATDP